MHLDLLRLTHRLPFTPPILERTHQFLLLCVHRNDGLAPLLKPLHRGTYKLELSIAVRMRFSFFRLAIALQAVPVRIQQPSYRSAPRPAIPMSPSIPGRPRCSACAHRLLCADANRWLHGDRSPAPSTPPTPCGWCSATCGSLHQRPALHPTRKLGTRPPPIAAASVHPSTETINGISLQSALAPDDCA